MILYERKEECCGCTACKYICPTSAIEMVPDEEGFLYPVINQELCIDCGKCRGVCAFQNRYDTSNNLDSPEAFAVKHKNEVIRMSSTSGGMFTAISDYVIKNNGIVYGVAFDDDMNVVHKMAKTSEERDLFKGSKYVQSNLKDTYKEIKELLKVGEQILFTGTPCQNAGLKRFLSNVNIENLILCDNVCHGTPSPLMWGEHVNHLEEKIRRPVLQYKFRDKSVGWRGANVTIKFEDKLLKNNRLSKTYSNLYFAHYMTRPACHNCKYSNLERPSDITMADFWGIEKSMPDFDDNKGISLALVNTIKGKKLFEDIRENLIYKECDVSDCLQPQLQYPSEPSPEREAFWEDYHLKGYNYVIKKYTGAGFIGQAKRLIVKVLNKLGLLGIVRKILGRD